MRLLHNRAEPQVDDCRRIKDRSDDKAVTSVIMWS